MKKITLVMFFVFLVFLLGVFSQRWLGHDSHPQAEAKKNEPLYWVAPMDLNYRRDKPGKSPMGMDLVPVYAQEKDHDPNVVKISSAVENNLGVKVASVERSDLNRPIETVGYVTADENNIEHIHAYTQGWIKKMHVKTQGEYVKPGELLLSIFSPTLVSAQEEWLLALKQNNNALIDAGRKKLSTLGMDKTQIQQLEKTRKIKNQVKIYAKEGGIVAKLNVREGMYIKPESEMMVIENLSNIWIIAEVFERQANWVKVDQQAIATLPYLPGKTWQGKVDYVYPQLDPKTHTLRVRLSFPNPDLSIKPNMYAQIKILTEPKKNVLSIPREAVIQTGQSTHVIVSLGDGRYRAQPIVMGIESDDQIEVLSGLQPNDKVVTSAQFLIDSESNFKASFARISDPQQIKQPIVQTYMGAGVVTKVDSVKHTITLDHDAIPALNMSKMVMDFKVAEEIDLSNIVTGSAIHFVMIKEAEHRYKITQIHVMKPKNSTHQNHDAHEGHQ